MWYRPVITVLRDNMWLLIVAFLKAHWKKILIVIGIVLLIGLMSNIFQSCRTPATYDEKTVQEVIKAIEQGETQKLKEILAESDMRESGAIEIVANSDTNLAKVQEEIRKTANKDYGHLTKEQLIEEAKKRFGQ